MGTEVLAEKQIFFDTFGENLCHFGAEKSGYEKTAIARNQMSRQSLS